MEVLIFMRSGIKSRRCYRKRYKRKNRAFKNIVIVGMSLFIVFVAAKIVGNKIPLIGMLVNAPSLVLEGGEIRFIIRIPKEI